MSVITAPAPATTVVQYADWLIDTRQTSAQHKTGLAIRQQRNRKGLAFIDIEGLEKLKGTAWEAKVNTLVEQGIFLIEGGYKTKQPATAGLRR